MIAFEYAKANFFDRSAVLDRVDRAKTSVLSRFGARVRRRAKRSFKRRAGASLPGAPPHSHSGLIERFILYSYDRESSSVVIGPTLIARPTGAPETLEYGGYADVPMGHGKTEKVFIRPRPYMGPAMRAELPKLEPMWRDSVR